MKLVIASKNHFFTVIFSFLFFLISILLFVFAPEYYSHSYCIVALLIYILSSLITIKNTLIKKNYFSFHILFLISYFYVNFVYPVFLYPKDPEYFPVFRFDFNHQIITVSTALALVGACAYNFGAVIMYRKNEISDFSSDINYQTIQFFLTIWSYFLFLLILVIAGNELRKGYFGAQANIPPGLLVIFQVSIGLSVILISLYLAKNENIFRFLWKFNKPILVLILFFVVLFIVIGDRGPVLQILLISIGAFALYFKPIKLKWFIIGILLGMFVFTFISYARSTNKSSNIEKDKETYIERGSKKLKLESVFDLGMDLIINNRNLYAGVEYTRKNGLNYGKSFSYNLFAPIPFLPSLMTNTLYNSPPRELTSAYLLTKDAGATYGLGTNIIADLYMAFGVLGVIFFMFILGFLVTYFQFRAIFSKNHYNRITYLFLIGFSVYLPRTTIFNPLRHIIWAVALMLLLISLRKALIRLSKNVEKQTD